MLHIQNLGVLFEHIKDPAKIALVNGPSQTPVIPGGFTKFIDKEKNAVGIRAAIGKDICFADAEIINGTGCVVKLISENGKTVKDMITYDLFPGQDVVFIVKDSHLVGVAPLFESKKEYKEYMSFVDALKLDSFGWITNVMNMVNLTSFLFFNAAK